MSCARSSPRIARSGDASLDTLGVGGSHLKTAQNFGRDPKPLTPRQWESVTKSLLGLVAKADKVSGCEPRVGSKRPVPPRDQKLIFGQPRRRSG